MRLLLDSHVIIWWVDNDHLLSTAAQEAIAEPENELLVSARTIWEVAIKYSLGKLKLSLPFRDWMDQAIIDLRAELLPISLDHADEQTSLPFHHRDPFDRLLVAQSMVEQIPIVRIDPALDAYGVQRIW